MIRILGNFKYRFATLALAEHNGSELSKNTFKLLSAAYKMNDETHLLVCGKQNPELQQNIKKTVGDKVTTVFQAQTSHLIGQQITNLVRGLVDKNKYKNVVGISSSFGKDIIPRISGYYAMQPISDIIEIQGENSYVRPTYAGNALTKVKTTQDINFLTFRPASFEQFQPQQSKTSFETVKVQDSKTQFVKQQTSDSNKPELTTARVVVSGGRGVKNKENFAIINELADAFGDAAVGASRAAVDSGYCPNELQVGQTGKVVAPELYLAIGISGAVQHIAGMKDSKVIVAINTKTDEPIFEYSTYGLEGDLFKVVPELIEKIKKLK